MYIQSWENNVWIINIKTLFLKTGVQTQLSQSLASLPYTRSFPSISPPLSLSLFSTHSLYMLPPCFLFALSLNTNNFFWQSIYGEVDWCMWGVCVFPEMHTIKRKCKHTLMRRHRGPSHIQPDIHQVAVCKNSALDLVTEVSSWAVIFLLWLNRFSSLGPKEKQPAQIDKSNKLPA